ncbi:MAG TPA: hypothetical protein VFS10_07160 [Pyrinomonadaceae bacterium]|nr:hypothetical protein [Pyrinomonadaceae bacterium]
MLDTRLLHPPQTDAANALTGVAERSLAAPSTPERHPRIVTVYQELGTGRVDVQLALALAAARLDSCRTLIIYPSSLANGLEGYAERARALDPEVVTAAHAPGAGGDEAATSCSVLLTIAPRVKGSLERGALDEGSFDFVIVDGFDAATALTAEVAGSFGASSLYVFWSGGKPEELHPGSTLPAGSVVIQGPADLLGREREGEGEMPSEPPPSYSDTRWLLRQPTHNPLGSSCIYAESGAGVGTIVQMSAFSPVDADEQIANARLIVAAVNLFVSAARAHSTNAVLLAERLELAGFADLFDERPQLPDAEVTPPAYTPRPWQLYTDTQSPQGHSQLSARHCRFSIILEMLASRVEHRAEQVGNARLIKASAGALLKTAEVWDVNPVLLAESLQGGRLTLALPLYRPRANNC